LRLCVKHCRSWMGLYWRRWCCGTSVTWIPARSVKY